MIRKFLIPACIAAIAAAFAAPAQASIDIASFSTSSSDTQAGGHPDLTTEFTLANPGAPEAARNVVFDAPEGVFGNPKAITRCTASDFALDQCPVNSQAGIVTVRAKYGGESQKVLGTAPLFDMRPQEGETARFAFIAPLVDIPIGIPVQVRTGSDYGLRFTVSEITQEIPLEFAKLTFWGIPTLKDHDKQRFPIGSPGEPSGCPEIEDTQCLTKPIAASIAPQPLVINPTTCTDAPLVTRLEVQSYQDKVGVGRTTSAYPATTGCENLTFAPVLSASITTAEADSPSGLNLGFRVPQSLGFTPSPSEARSVTVALPPGLTINPDAADGQSACSDLQANFGNEAPASCPDNSKIGTASISSPALDGLLRGSLYIGEPKPGDQYRIFLIVSGFGLNAKLVGSLKPDLRTGQLTAHFDDLPQVPFEEFDVHLFASDRGLMATPTACTLYPVRADFEPWDSRISGQMSEQQLSIMSGPRGTACPGVIRPFAPSLVAGASNPVGGAYSKFYLRLDRNDGDQYLRDLNFKMPPGFTGNLRGISYCNELQIRLAAANTGRSERAIPSCPASSFIGTTNVAAGPGEHPFHAVGRVYLSGPLNGAPLSLVAVTPALAGPYDYGVVVVRVALQVDPLTAQVTAVSDTVPSIIGGIPIRMRSIQVNIDRDNFTINPTNCSNFTVDSQGIGDQGSVSDFSSPFHAVNCRSLGFKPRMTIRQLGKRGQTKRTKNPKLRFDLYTRPGDANLSSLSVTLSKAFQIDQRHLFNICSRSQLAADLCAGRQPMGKVKVWTPLLDHPLEGQSFAVSGFGKLPRLVFILNGQVRLLPQAESESIKRGSVKGYLKTIVPVIPDAPIGHFRLTLFGGRKGYLQITRDLCIHPGAVQIDYEGQNGRKRTQRVRPKEPCGRRRAVRRHHRRAAR